MSDAPLNTIALHDLVARIQAGDPAARDELVRRAGLRLERLARRMLRTFPAVRRFEQTDDVLQSAMVRLLNALRDVRPTTTRSFFNFAAQMIRRELLDLARHHGGVPAAAVNGAPTTHPVEDPAELERWAAFHEAAAGLPDDEREVFGLTFYEGLGRGEVARVLGVDEKTVRRRWRRAADLLAEHLGDELPT